jgi:hypothetical protein
MSAEFRIIKSSAKKRGKEGGFAFDIRSCNNVPIELSEETNI